MLRTLVLLVATLAVVALAAPAPKVQRSVSSWGFGSKHSFKSSTRGHRGNRDPRTEISRVYNKFKWDTSKFTWSITLPLSGTTLKFGYGSGSSTDSPYDIPDGSSPYGSPDGSSSGSSPIDAPASTVSSYIIASQYSEAPAATSLDIYATESYAMVAPSSEAVDASAMTTFATRTSTAASVTATANAPDDGGSGEVKASPEPNESEYLSPVKIGGQQLNLNFDTGSADL
jgi:hypothetical protein